MELVSREIAVNSKIKWWINSIAGAIFVMLCAVYLLIRPIVVQNLDPVLKEQSVNLINGSLTWEAVDLDPKLNLSFTNLVLKDQDGNNVLETPSLTVGWSLSSLYNYLVNHAGVSSVVNSVTVDDPAVTIAQQSDGSWNITHILKLTDSEENNVFRGRVIIHNGNARVTSNSAGNFDFSKLDGTFIWDKDSHITGDLTGSLLDSSFSSHLKYTDSKNLAIDIKTDPVSLKSLQGLVDSIPQVQHKLILKDGTGQVTEAKISTNNNVVAYRITGSFNHAALGYENFNLADGAAFFYLENGNLSLKDVDAKVNGQHITGDVNINFAGKEAVYQGNATFDRLDLSEFVPDDIQGIMDGQVSFSGTVSNPQISGNVIIKNGNYQNLIFKEVKAIFSYDQGKLDLSSLDAEAAGGNATAHGTYDMNSGSFNIQADAENIDLTQIPVNQNISGHATGFLLADGVYSNGSFILDKASFNGEVRHFAYDDIKAQDFQGFGSYKDGIWKFTGNGQLLSYRDVNLDNLAVSLESENGKIHIPYASGISGEGSFYVTGDFSQYDEMNLQIDAARMDLSQFSSIAGEEISGLADVHGHISGTMENPEGNFRVHAKDGYLKTVQFNTIDGNVVFHDQYMDIKDLALKGESGSHMVTGKVGIQAPHTMNVTVKTERSRIESLLAAAGLDYPVTGWIDNSLTIHGDADNPVINGDFKASDGSVMGELFQNISGLYSYDNGELKITNALGYIYDGVVLLNGTYTAQGLDFDVSLTDISIDHMIPDKGIEGRISLNGKVKGTVDNLSFDGIASAREVTIGGNTIRNVSSGIHYRDHVVYVDEGFFRQKAGTFQWKGSYNMSSGALQGYLDFNRWNISDILKILNKSVEGVDGTVEGGVQIGGTVDNPSVNFKAHVLGGHLGDAVLGEGDIDFSYMNKALSIRKFSIPVGEGLLAAQGSMNSEGNLDIQAAAKDMDISWIPAVLGRKEISVGGQLTAALNLSGTKTDPVADISVGIDHPCYGEIAFDNMSLMANAANNVVVIQNAVISRDIYRATMKGSMPGNLFTGSTTDKAVPMNLDVNLDQADMNMLALFFKPVTSASGPIHGHVSITGSYDNPLLFGGVSAKDARLTLITLNEPVSPINLNLSFAGNTAAFEGSADFGGGQMTAKGDMSWDHYSINHYSGELHVHTPNINSVYYKGSLDGDFTLGEVNGYERPGFEGTLKVQNATVDIPFALLGESGSNDLNLLTRISVQVGDNVRLYNSAFYDLMIRGNIGMLGPVNDPIMSGRVNVEKGTVRINTSTFKVEQAHAVWGNEAGSFLPDVYAKAVTKVGHYNITAELEGAVNNMKTTFHSEPALNDSQILMLLTLHQNPNNKEDNEAMEGALFNAGLTMLFGNGIQDFLQDKIGLDQISITSSLTDYYDNVDDSNDNYYYIKIGKYIFNDFMLTATMGMNNEERSVGMHYDLNSRIGISSWYNSKHDSYIGTDWNFRF